jgi:hypothetical protein
VANTRSRARSKAGAAGSRLKALPWAAVLQMGVAFNRRWSSLSDRDRARLTQLLRGSRGRPRNLSTRERDELRKLVGKLDLKGMGRELLPLVRAGRRRRR